MSIERGSPEAGRLQLLGPVSGASAKGAEPGSPVLSPDEVIQPDGTRIAFRDGRPVDRSPEEEFVVRLFNTAPAGTYSINGYTITLT